MQVRDFADEEGISPYAADAVDWASANGVINGKPDNRFDPKGAATRAEVAAILMNNAELEDGVQSDIDNPMPKHQDGSDSPSGSKVLKMCIRDSDNNYRQIAVLPFKLGHMCEVQSVPARQQCKRQKESGDNCECSHNLILPGVLLRPVSYTHLVSSILCA